ncbi:MAG: cupin domain-containing protein [Oscillospiraceae bacterium]|nr:cupin domain-containing protein [Oscillospiraceae bacterium]
MFVFNSDCKIANCEPGVTRKVLAYSDELMMCEVSFQTGAKGNAHSHEHLQITYVAKGKFEFTVGDETKTVSAGDSIYIPSNVMHHTVCLEAGMLVDIFNPKRDDFLK